MEVDSGTPAAQEAAATMPPPRDDAFHDDDSFGSAASQQDEPLDDDEHRPRAAMPAHALPPPHHQARHAASDDDEDDASDDDEEEAECRVCRGPAEEGRPLYSPCKCSGSIGLCHQDCLTSWLEVTHGGGGRCELCSYRFRFRPLYAPDAPERLPPHEVLLGLGRSAVVKFLPFLLRIGLSLGVWLVVLPLCSAYLYQGWFHSPKSVAARWHADLLLRDGVSGAFVAAVVVFSFLSLMSLADFMRFQWNPDAQAADDANADANANANANNANADEQEAAAEEARAEAQMAAIRAGGIDAMREAVEAIAAENGIDLEAEERAMGFVRNDRRQEEAAMPDPFELDVGADLDRHHHQHHHRHHHPHHHRNQRQRQRDLVPPVAHNDGNMDNGNGDTVGIGEEDAADARARRQMERIRGRIEERRRQNRDVLERENSRPISPDISDVEEDEDLYDNIQDYATAAADRRNSNLEAEVLLPLGSPLESWLDRPDAAAGQAPPSPTHSRPGSLSSLPSLNRDAVGVMDEGEPFFSNDPTRTRTRSADDDDEELRRRRRLLAERAALRRQKEEEDDIGLKNDDGDDKDSLDDESEDAGSEPLLTSEMADDMSEIASDQAETEQPDYISDNSTTNPSPLEDGDMMDLDEAALENMMRLQEEAMLDSDDEDGDSVDANDAPAAPVDAQQGQPQNAAGRFEPQFEPLDPGFEQEEEMDMEFQLALDELLGFRGPVGTLLRNLLFFLAFITTYLGLFGFVPYQLGSFASRSRLLSFLARPLASATRSVLDLMQIMVSVHFNVATVATNASDAEVANLTTAMNSLNASNIINLTEGFAFPTVFTALASESAPTTERTAAEAAAEAAANITYLAQQINGTASLPDASVIFFRVLDFESKVWNTIFRLPDIMKLVFGYFVIGAIVMMLQALVAYIAKKPADSHQELPRRLEPIPLNAEQQAAAERLGIHFDDNQDNGQDAAALQEELQNQDEYIEIKLTVVMDYARAVMKVSMLLFLKMVILPLTLGFSLDLATLELFNATAQSRVLHAGRDLFGSLLVHWVAGITFMLLVTVSVLQLREVIHPDLLARVVRPQEPQPDLLGNMLKERGFTHAKRMLHSLSIYLGLLVVNVWAPAKLLIVSGLSKSIPVFQPKIWHVVIPQLQIPIELLVFHLSMLAFLEKYKNCIGMLQHKWLVAVCDVLGLTDYLIPKEVGKFNLVATRPVFCRSDLASPSSSFDSEGDSVPPLDEATIITQSTSASAATLTHNRDALPIATKKSTQSTKPSSNSSSNVLDPFWAELISMSKEKNVAPESIDDFIVANINTSGGVADTGRWTSGITTDAGKRMLDDAEESIDLPLRPTDSKLWPFYEDDNKGKMKDATASAVLPTTIGAYRFRLRSSAGGMAMNSGSSGNVIEIWKEDRGAPIPRPPEGWDDLGVGGAEVQGRWAWDKEKKSTIEEGVAHRSTFFGSAKDGESRLTSAFRRWPRGLFLSSKVAILVVISWLAMSIFVCCGITAPLIAGRFIYFLLQVPDRFMHDPVAYTAGAMVVFPLLIKVVRLAAGGREEEGKNVFAAWKSGFCLPPRGSYKLRYVMQAICLWTIVIPLLLGLTYHIFLVKGTSFWLYKESPFNANDIAMAWGAGTLLLNSWAVLCYFGAFKLGFWLDLIAGPPQEPDAAAQPQPQPQPAANPAAPNVEGAAAAAADVAGDANGTDVNGAAEERENQMEPFATPRHWQGQDGFVGRMIDTIFAVLGRWEWDKVDRDILLAQTLIPITQQLLILLVGPIFAYLGWSALLSALTHGRGSAGIILPFVGLVEKDIYRRFFYRCFAITTVLIQLASSFQSSLQRWFRAAHKAARDDRYLQGEILMNYAR